MANDYSYPSSARLLHLCIALFGITAYLTAELAEDGGSGYLLHAYLGLSLTASILVRVVGGFTRHPSLSFSGWSPLTARQWSLALDDVRNLIRLNVPERGMHLGLAGITQAAGIALFAWMGVTGSGMFLLGEDGGSDLFEALEELHEVGESLIPLYLVLHVGSVVVHALAGHPIWRRMWTFRDPG